MALLVAPAVANGDDTGLVAQWHLDAVTGGATPDSSGNGLTGDEVAGTLIPGGRFANALSTANRPKIGILQLAVTISANGAKQAALHERIVLLRA